MTTDHSAPPRAALLRGRIRLLTRSRVLRVGAAYVVVATGTVAAASDLLPRLQLQDWTVTFVAALALLGLPVTLVLTWALHGDTDELEASRGSETRFRPADLHAAPATPPIASTDRRRLAVLPFANISPDPSDEYFADGMTEELISVLSRIQGLDVIARTSIMQYRNQPKAVSEIAHELGVGSVLEGSVRRAGDRLRITVQLIDAATQSHVWAQDYDRELRDVFVIQSDIARHVADGLELRLLERDRTRLERTPTHDMAAYDQYLMGRYYFNQRTAAGLAQAIECFGKATLTDPSFAAPFAGLADAYAVAAIGFSTLPHRDGIAQARSAARRALALDETLSDAHAALAYASLFDWDWPTARRHFERALELDPANAHVYEWYAHWFVVTGDYEQILACFRRARDLDPLSIVINTQLGWPLNYMGRHDEAIEIYRRVLSMDPKFALAHFDLGWSFQLKGEPGLAIDSLERAAALSGNAAYVSAWLGSAYAQAGRIADARAVLARLEQQAGEGHAVATFAAIVAEALGERDDAFAWLERALDEREPAALFTCLEPLVPLPSLRREPRFAQLTARMNLPGRASVQRQMAN
ncbi:MAG TPA: hypothetical protein VMN60_13365 [Longimicrobiales bacterium]|nr:hypothetical protein [Longimicrobiales bacterium]